MLQSLESHILSIERSRSAVLSHFKLTHFHNFYEVKIYGYDVIKCHNFVLFPRLKSTGILEVFGEETSECLLWTVFFFYSKLILVVKVVSFILFHVLVFAMDLNSQ